MKAANIQSESSKTDGAPPPKPLSNQEETILVTLPLKSVHGIDGGMDTSESQETMAEEVCLEMKEDEAMEEVMEEAAVTPKIPSAANKPSLKRKSNDTNEIKEAMSLQRQQVKLLTEICDLLRCIVVGLHVDKDIHLNK